MSKVFVSHSSLDEKIVNSFVSNVLQLGMNIDRKDIFCTSSDGMGITSGDDWRNKIRENLLDAKVIFLLITPNYKASEICLNEMGAAWVSGARVIPLLISPIDYKSVGVVVETKQMEKVDDNGMDHVFDAVKDIIPNVKSDVDISIWGSKKRKFLKELKEILKEKIFPKAYSQKEMEEKAKELEQLQESYDRLLEEKDKLIDEIDELKRCKDKEEVKEIESKYEQDDVVERFEEMLNDARFALRGVSAAVRTIIYNQRAKAEIRIDVNSSEIREAVAKKQLEEYDGYFRPLYKKSDMKEIKKALDSIDEFIETVSDNEYDLLMEKYEILETDDLDFWEKVINIQIERM